MSQLFASGGPRSESGHFVSCRGEQLLGLSTLPLLFLPSVFPSIRVFSSESALRIRWPKDCSFSINPSSEYSRLISFRIDQFDLLGVQGILKNLLQHQSSKKKINILLILVKIHIFTNTLENI